MPSTLSGSELSLALLAEPEGTSNRLIFASAMLSLASGRPVKVSVRMTNGQYHWLEISTQISTDTASENGGDDKA